MARESSILWSAGTTVHDASDGRLARRLLEQATGAGLIGRVSWRKEGIHGEPREVSLPHAAALLDAPLPQPLPDEPPHAYLEAGGEQPEPWEATISLSPFDADSRQPLSVSRVNVFFSERLASSPARSDDLARAFRDVHGPDDTEHAFVHPYRHWLAFARAHYRRAITIGPMFKGVFWANFLGPGHIEEFDLAKLRAITAHEVDWFGSQGLSLFATAYVLESREPAGEAELLRLTRLFRDALRPDSRWR